MSLHARRLLYATVLCLLASCGGGGGGGGDEGTELRTVSLPPGSGITMQRVFFLEPFDGDSAPTWGRIVIDPAVVAEHTGQAGGVLNVVHEDRWLAVNVPVPPPEEPPLSVYFDVGGPPDPDIPGFGQGPVWCLWSNRTVEGMGPVISDAPLSEYVFGRAEWNARGIPNEYDDVFYPGPPPSAIAIDDVQAVGTETWARYQSVVNVECAVDQCFPMAIANGLQYLEDEGVLTIPHTHALGLKGDSTLVGMLDTACDRPATSRTVGDGVWFPAMLDGTFLYLDDNQLGGVLDHRHQDRGYGDAQYDEPLPNGNFTRHAITSTDDGASITWDWIVARIRDGCAVTAVYTFEGLGGLVGGAHAVRITAVGVLAGDPWLRYSHDANQGNDTDGLESVLVMWGDTDNDGLFNFGSPDRELRFVFAACP